MQNNRRYPAEKRETNLAFINSKVPYAICVLLVLFFVLLSLELVDISNTVPCRISTSRHNKYTNISTNNSNSQEQICPVRCEAFMMLRAGPAPKELECSFSAAPFSGRTMDSIDSTVVLRPVTFLFSLPASSPSLARPGLLSPPSLLYHSHNSSSTSGSHSSLCRRINQPDHNFFF